MDSQTPRDPPQWTPRDGARRWAWLARSIPRDDLASNRLAWSLFMVGSYALLAYQRAVDALSERWTEQAAKIGDDPARQDEADRLRELAREMREALSGARLPHVPPGQRTAMTQAAGEHPPCPACGSTEADCKPGCSEVAR